jgi:hypothetical protein
MVYFSFEIFMHKPLQHKAHKLPEPNIYFLSSWFGLAAAGLT